jgi:hypothetical protein
LARIFRVLAFYRGDSYQHFGPGAITTERQYARYVKD